MEMRGSGVTNDANSKPRLWVGLCLLPLSKKPQPLMNTGTLPRQSKGCTPLCGGGEGAGVHSGVQGARGYRGKGELNWQ